MSYREGSDGQVGISDKEHRSTTTSRDPVLAPRPQRSAAAGCLSAVTLALLAIAVLRGALRAARAKGRIVQSFEEATTETPKEKLSRLWSTPPGPIAWLGAVNHKKIGIRFIVTGFFFFLIAGVDALTMRTQLIQPDMDLVPPDVYNQLFTTHGTAMMFFFAVPVMEGFAIYMAPLMIGARDMVFPRLNAFGYWCYLFGGLLLYGTTLPDIPRFLFGIDLGQWVPHGAWYSYTPLTDDQYFPKINHDFWLMAVTLAEISGIIFAIEMIATIFKARAPGMSINRMPLFVWTVLAMVFAILIAFPTVVTASTLLELDRSFDTRFYDPTAGGDPILWQHLFWIFGHPEVYIMLLPAVGIVSMIVPVFSRQPIVGYIFFVLAAITIAAISFGLWVHHMFTTGLTLLGLSFFGIASMMIAIPSGVQIFGWITTMWKGPKIELTTPMLFVLGFIIVFVLGGFTGVMVAAVPFDWEVHDSYFLIAHFHYVLIGGVVFPFFAGVYYWFPKLTGKMLSETLGKINFGLAFIGFNLTFFPMHFSGFLGMTRRVYTYPAGIGLETPNLLSSLGAYTVAASVLLFLFNVIRTLLSEKHDAGANPWRANTLEWAAASPPDAYNFASIPIVHSRDPLWDQEHALGREPRGDERALLPDTQYRWRQTLGTSVLDAKPESIIHLPMMSHLPLFLALSLLVVILGVLGKFYWVMAVGFLLIIVFTIRWTWPQEQRQIAWNVSEITRDEHLPQEVSGKRSIDWWGLVLTLAALGSIFAALIFSYFFIAFGTASWPPDGFAPPSLLLPGIATAILLSSAIPMYRADQGIRHSDVHRVEAGLSWGIVSGLLFLGIIAWDAFTVEVTPVTNAYGSIFFTVIGYVYVLLVVGLIMAATTLVRTWKGHFNHRRFGAIENTALYWQALLVAWAVAFATAYLSPYVL